MTAVPTWLVDGLVDFLFPVADFLRKNPVPGDRLIEDPVHLDVDAGLGQKDRPGEKAPEFLDLFSGPVVFVEVGKNPDEIEHFFQQTVGVQTRVAGIEPRVMKRGRCLFFPSEILERPTGDFSGVFRFGRGFRIHVESLSIVLGSGLSKSR